MSAAILLARKEAGELLVSRGGLAWLLTLAAVLSGFTLLLVGSSELSLLDNAQVVYDMAGLVTALGALLAVVVGTDSIAGERQRGSLVPLLLAPISKPSLLAGKIGGQLATWLVMLILALPYLWAVGSTGQNLGGAVSGLLLLGTPVVLGFGFLGIGLAARTEGALASLLTSLILIILSASPVLLGPSLRHSAVGRLFDAVNPFSAALNALDAVIIDSEPLMIQFHYIAAVFVWLSVTALLALTGLRRLTR